MHERSGRRRKARDWVGLASKLEGVAMDWAVTWQAVIDCTTPMAELRTIEQSSNRTIGQSNFCV